MFSMLFWQAILAECGEPDSAMPQVPPFSPPGHSGTRATPVLGSVLLHLPGRREAWSSCLCPRCSPHTRLHRRMARVLGSTTASPRHANCGHCGPKHGALPRHWALRHGRFYSQVLYINILYITLTH